VLSATFFSFSKNKKYWQQEQEVLAELLFADLVGSASVVLSQLVNGSNITLLGLGGEPPQLQILEHAASQCGHGNPPVRVEHNPSQTVDTNKRIDGRSA